MNTGKTYTDGTPDFRPYLNKSKFNYEKVEIS